MPQFGTVSHNGERVVAHPSYPQEGNFGGGGGNSKRSPSDGGGNLVTQQPPILPRDRVSRNKSSCVAEDGPVRFSAGSSRGDSSCGGERNNNIPPPQGNNVAGPVPVGEGGSTTTNKSFEVNVHNNNGSSGYKEQTSLLFSNSSFEKTLLDEEEAPPPMDHSNSSSSFASGGASSFALEDLISRTPSGIAQPENNAVENTSTLYEDAAVVNNVNALNIGKNALVINNNSTDYGDSQNAMIVDSSLENYSCQESLLSKCCNPLLDPVSCQSGAHGDLHNNMSSASTAASSSLYQRSSGGTTNTSGPLSPNYMNFQASPVSSRTNNHFFHTSSFTSGTSAPSTGTSGPASPVRAFNMFSPTRELSSWGTNNQNSNPSGNQNNILRPEGQISSPLVRESPMHELLLASPPLRGGFPGEGADTSSSMDTASPIVLQNNSPTLQPGRNQYLAREHNGGGSTQEEHKVEEGGEEELTDHEGQERRAALSALDMSFSMTGVSTGREQYFVTGAATSASGRQTSAQAGFAIPGSLADRAAHFMREEAEREAAEGRRGGTTEELVLPQGVQTIYAQLEQGQNINIDDQNTTNGRSDQNLLPVRETTGTTTNVPREGGEQQEQETTSTVLRLRAMLEENLRGGQATSEPVNAAACSAVALWTTAVAPSGSPARFAGDQLAAAGSRSSALVNSSAGVDTSSSSEVRVPPLLPEVEESSSSSSSSSRGGVIVTTTTPSGSNARNPEDNSSSINAANAEDNIHDSDHIIRESPARYPVGTLVVDTAMNTTTTNEELERYEVESGLERELERSLSPSSPHLNSRHLGPRAEFFGGVANWTGDGTSSRGGRSRGSGCRGGGEPLNSSSQRSSPLSLLASFPNPQNLLSSMDSEYSSNFPSPLGPQPVRFFPGINHIPAGLVEDEERINNLTTSLQQEERNDLHALSSASSHVVGTSGRPADGNTGLHVAGSSEDFLETSQDGDGDATMGISTIGAEDALQQLSAAESSASEEAPLHVVDAVVGPPQQDPSVFSPSAAAALTNAAAAMAWEREETTASAPPSSSHAAPWSSGSGGGPRAFHSAGNVNIQSAGNNNSSCEGTAKCFAGLGSGASSSSRENVQPGSNFLPPIASASSSSGGGESTNFIAQPSCIATSNSAAAAAGVASSTSSTDPPVTSSAKAKNGSKSTAKSAGNSPLPRAAVPRSPSTLSLKNLLRVGLSKRRSQGGIASASSSSSLHHPDLAVHCVDGGVSNGGVNREVRADGIRDVEFWELPLYHLFEFLTMEEAIR